MSQYSLYCKVVDNSMSVVRSGYEVDNDFLNTIRDILYEQGKSVFSASEPKSRKTPNATQQLIKHNKRRLAGYNLFVQEESKKLKEAKEQGTVPADITSQQHFAEFGAKWRELPDEEKAKYKALALQQSATDPASSSSSSSSNDATTKTSGKKPKRITGYNLYYKENHERIKQEQTTPLPEGTSILSVVGAQWKLLEKAEKTLYNDRAKAINESVAHEESESTSASAHT